MTQIEFDAHHPPLDTVDAPAYPQLTAERFRPTSWRKVATLVGNSVLLFGIIATLIYFYAPIGDYYERRTSGGTSVTVNYTDSQSDMLDIFGDTFRPLTQNTRYGQWPVTFDFDGWRMPNTPAESYPVAVFGNSMTEALNAAEPFPSGMIEHLGVGVYNYGYRGYGPEETARAVREFAYREARTALIWAYTPGSEIAHVPRDYSRTRFQSDRPVLEALIRDLFFGQYQTVSTSTSGESAAPVYEMPISMTLQGETHEVAFYPSHRYRMQLSADAFTASKHRPYLIATLETFEQAAAVDNACPILAYLPTKDSIYIRYVDEPYLSQILAENQRYGLNSGGLLVHVPDPIDDSRREAFLAGFDTQRDVIRGMVESRPGWTFVDLTPAFEQAAARGEILYYPFDTHWNQAGHDLAAQVIAQALQENGCLP